MKVEEVWQTAKEKIEQLAAELERGQSATLKTYLAAIAKFPRYSVNNLLLILAQRPDARQIAGFNTWRRLGRHVRKGERGIAILAPVTRRRRAAAATPKAADEAELDQAAATGDRGVVVGFRGAFVFDISQTDGTPLPEPASVNGDPRGFLDRLKQVVAHRGIKLSHSSAVGPARGVSMHGQIVLLPGMSSAEEFATLAHELAHQALHPSGQTRTKSKTVRETEAEAVAFVVCQAIGLDTNSASSDYIALYDGDPKTLAASLERIQQAAAEIITAIGPGVGATKSEAGGPNRTLSSVREGPRGQAA